MYSTHICFAYIRRCFFLPPVPLPPLFSFVPTPHSSADHIVFYYLYIRAILYPCSHLYSQLLLFLYSTCSCVFPPTKLSGRRVLVNVAICIGVRHENLNQKLFLFFTSDPVRLPPTRTFTAATETACSYYCRLLENPVCLSISIYPVSFHFSRLWISYSRPLLVLSSPLYPSPHLRSIGADIDPFLLDV